MLLRRQRRASPGAALGARRRSAGLLVRHRSSTFPRPRATPDRSHIDVIRVRAPRRKHVFERRVARLSDGSIEDVLARSNSRSYVRSRRRMREGERDVHGAGRLDRVRGGRAGTVAAAVPARRVAVRGGAACAQRMPVVRETSRRLGTAARGRPFPVTVRSPAPSTRCRRRGAAPRLRLTRRGRVVLVVLPALLALSGRPARGGARCCRGRTQGGVARHASSSAPATACGPSPSASRRARTPARRSSAMERANGLRTARVAARGRHSCCPVR